MGLAEILLHLALLPGPILRTSAPADTADAQLVAVLQLRREDLPHDLRGEIYPVALLADGSYRDARTGGVHPLTGDPERTIPRGDSPLDSIHDFTVYHDAAAIGRFRVASVESAVYSCRALRIGLGEMDLPDEYVRFGRLDPRVQTFAVSAPGFSYQYALNYYVALSRPFPQPAFGWDPGIDPTTARRLRDALWRAGTDALARGSGADGESRAGAPRWSTRQPFRTFDLDRDGRPEAMGVVEAVMVGEPAPTTTSPRLASAIVWARDEGPARIPTILAVLLQADAAGRVDARRFLAEVMDLDGDGVAELFYQIDGWEVHGFEIHALVEGRLETVFEGGGYGC